MNTTDSLRILVIGNTGQVGWELCRTMAPLGHVIGVDYPELDMAEGASIHNCVRDARPGLVVNAAAYTAVDKAETESDLAMKINGVAPGILAQECKTTGALLIHYSTDYVFDGATREPYLEDDPPNPLSVYGRTKLAGEHAVQQVGGNHLIFRLCWVYGARGHNFMLTIMRLARERERLRVVTDQVGSPTWSRIIAETTALAAHRVITAPDPGAFKGIYHLSASGSTSRHGFAQAIVSRLPAADRKCREVTAITTAEYPTPARRPACSVLGCDKLRRTFGLTLPKWEASLNLVLDACSA